MYTRNIISILFILCMILLPVSAIAQTTPEPGDDPDEIPIDGGASLLAGAAVVYGIAKARKARK